MIPALVIGRGGSVSFPGKNTVTVLGRPLMAYPLLAASESKYVDDIFISTDSDEIKSIAGRFGAKIIERPPELATKEALGEDAFRHGYFWIKDHVESDIEMIVLLFCNSASLTGSLIDEGIEKLRMNATFDSAVSVSVYNMWSPLRARKINSQGLLDPFVPFETFGDPKTLNCDRDSQGDVWFADMGVSVVRPRCLENLREGLLPQRWMGKRIYPLKQEFGCDIDFEWQLPVVEFWLKSHGFSAESALYDDEKNSSSGGKE